MEATQLTPAGIAASPTHPLLLIAAASVTVLSLAGVGALAGWLPGPGGHGAEPAKTASAPPPVVATATATIPQTVSVPQARPAARSSERAPASVRHTASVPVASTPPFTAPPATAYSTPAPTQPICRDCGVVQAVNTVSVEPKNSGGGAVAGGVVGGIIGNQIGKGATRDIATVLGAVGGAYAGNHIEKSSKESKRYDVVVRFEDGSTRTFSSDSPPAWQSGDRVRLQNGLLTMGGGRSGDTAGVI
jgi:outer membrane lipoprotein SlyB